MKKLMSKEKLYLRIFIGFALGIILGLAWPAAGLKIEVFGTIYLNMLKIMIVPILMCAVADGICNVPVGVNLKKLGLKTVATYVLQFFACAGFSYLIAFILQPGKGVRLESITTVVVDAEAESWSFTDFLTSMFPTNIFNSMMNNDILPIIIFTAAFSVAVVACGKAAAPIKKGIHSLSTVVFKMLGYVMEVSPIGVFALMATSMAKYGTAMFSAIASYLISCWIACIASFFVCMVLPLWLYTRMNPLDLLRGMGKIALITMSTTSSAATLPTTIRVAEDDFGVPKAISEFTLPLGCTINMTGGACEYSCLVFFVANLYGLHYSPATMIMMVLVSTLINMAAPGMPGGGIVLGVSFLSTFNLPFEIMGPIGAVYRIIDMIFTTMNVAGDVTANLFIAKSEGVWNRSMITYHKKKKQRLYPRRQQMDRTDEFISAAAAGRPVKVGYQGLIFSNNYTAAGIMAERYCRAGKAGSAELIPLLSSKNVVDALVNGETDIGVMAWSTDCAGLVAETQQAVKDIRFEKLDFVSINIHHCLFKKDVSVPDTAISAIASHPEALKECRNKVREFYPDAEMLSVADTAAAALSLSRGELSNTCAVLCSREAGESNGLVMIRGNMEDLAFNGTDFVMIRLLP